MSLRCAFVSAGASRKKKTSQDNQILKTFFSPPMQASKNERQICYTKTEGLPYVSEEGVLTRSCRNRVWKITHGLVALLPLLFRSVICILQYALVDFLLAERGYFPFGHAPYLKESVVGTNERI